MNNIGTVLRFRGNKAIVFTAHSDFIMIKSKPDMFIGKEILYDEADIVKKSSNAFKYTSIAVSAAVIIITLMIFARFSFTKEVYAYIDIDINPSMELAIDKEGIVIDTKPLNEDAQKIMEQVKVENKDFKIALAEIVGKSEKDGFLNYERGKKVLISTALNSKDQKDKGMKEDQKLNRILLNSNNYVNQLHDRDITFYVLKVTPEVRDSAKRNQTSMGRYYIYVKTKVDGEDVSLDKIKKSTVSQIVDMAHLDGNKAKVEPKHEIPVKTGDSNKKNTVVKKPGVLNVKNHSATQKGNAEKPKVILKKSTGVKAAVVNKSPDMADQSSQMLFVQSLPPPPEDSLQGEKRDNDPGQGSCIPYLTSVQEGCSGNYMIIMNMESGSNPNKWNLYENDVLIYTGSLKAGSTDVQETSKAFQNKAKGTYLYRCELIDSDGKKSTSSTINVVVEGPGTPDLKSVQEGNSGNYTVIMKMEGGNNGNKWNLYENGVLVYTGNLEADTPKAQEASKTFKNKAKGTYLYKCELIDSNGVKSTSATINVVVEGPGTPCLKAVQEDNSGNYTVVMEMDGGNNGDKWNLYENGVLIYTGNLEADTPNAQKAAKTFKNKANGTYLYKCELIDSNGEKSTSATINVIVK